MKKGKKRDVVGTVFVERLAHFSCGSCHRWWSVGDWTIVKRVTCPHCGTRQLVVQE